MPARYNIVQDRQKMQAFKFKNQTLILHPSRVVFWEEQSALILSDLHFGKTGHFRKAGIAVPQSVYKEDIQRLFSLIQFFNPRQLIVAGDLFHSHANKELELFRKWRQDHPSLVIKLVKGNHDILKQTWYDETNIETYHCELLIDNFLFTHDVSDCDISQKEGQYLFSGHIHPGVSLHGIGKQSLRFPCFYFTDKYCVLPAFSRFTGTYQVHPKNDDKVFAIVEDRILDIR